MIAPMPKTTRILACLIAAASVSAFAHPTPTNRFECRQDADVTFEACTQNAATEPEFEACRAQRSEDYDYCDRVFSNGTRR